MVVAVPPMLEASATAMHNMALIDFSGDDDFGFESSGSSETVSTSLRMAS
jgi:hypothetical protein